MIKKKIVTLFPTPELKVQVSSDPQNAASLSQLMSEPVGIIGGKNGLGLQIILFKKRPVGITRGGESPVDDQGGE